MTDQVNKELEQAYMMLKSIYGRDLMAATLIVLLKEKDGQLRYLSNTFPQEDEK